MFKPNALRNPMAQKKSSPVTISWGLSPNHCIGSGWISAATSPLVGPLLGWWVGKRFGLWGVSDLLGFSFLKKSSLSWKTQLKALIAFNTEASSQQRQWTNRLIMAKTIKNILDFTNICLIESHIHQNCIYVASLTFSKMILFWYNTPTLEKPEEILNFTLAHGSKKGPCTKKLDSLPGFLANKKIPKALYQKETPPVFQPQQTVFIPFSNGFVRQRPSGWAPGALECADWHRRSSACGPGINGDD